MRALVVYESMYGSTHVIADNIADGLRADYEVAVVPVREATPELVAAADLVVAGAPTHLRGLPSARSRRMAAQAAAKDGSKLRIDTAVVETDVHHPIDKPRRIVEVPMRGCKGSEESLSIPNRRGPRGVVVGRSPFSFCYLFEL